MHLERTPTTGRLVINAAASAMGRRRDERSVLSRRGDTIDDQVVLYELVAELERQQLFSSKRYESLEDSTIQF
jgi:hypothetical protein